MVLLKIVLGFDAKSDYWLWIMVTVCTVLVLHIWLTEKTRTVLFLKMCSELVAKWRNGLHANFSGQHHLWHTENSGSQSLNAHFFELPTRLHSFPCACHFEDKAGVVEVRVEFIAKTGNSSSSVNSMILQIGPEQLTLTVFYDLLSGTCVHWICHYVYAACHIRKHE